MLIAQEVSSNHCGDINQIYNLYQFKHNYTYSLLLYIRRQRWISLDMDSFKQEKRQQKTQQVLNLLGLFESTWRRREDSNLRSEF
jgi:hypothetical protein